MVSYPYAWTPVVIVVGTAVLLTNAYLALIALMLVAFFALPLIAAAIIAAPYLLGRSIYRRWHEQSSAGPRRQLHAGRAEDAGTR